MRGCMPTEKAGSSHTDRTGKHTQQRDRRRDRERGHACTESPVGNPMAGKKKKTAGRKRTRAESPSTASNDVPENSSDSGADMSVDGDGDDGFLHFMPAASSSSTQAQTLNAGEAPTLKRPNQRGSSEVRRKTTNLYRPPTAEEMMEMREADSLYTSNLIKIQTEELVREVRVDYGKCKTMLDPAIHRVKAILETAPAQAVDRVAAIRLMKELGALTHSGPEVEIPDIHSKTFSMEFTPPSEISLVGSYLHHSTCKPILNVDIACQIPPGCLKDPDYVQHRYFEKRNVYLAILACHLSAKLQKGNKSEVMISPQLSLQPFPGDARKLILIVHLKNERLSVSGPTTAASSSSSVGQQHSKKKKALDFEIRILLSYTEGTFPARKLLPSKNAVRMEGLSTEDPAQPPTPHYNMSVLEDSLLESHFRLCHVFFADLPEVASAALLARVWLYNRHPNPVLQEGRGYAEDGLNGFLVDMILSYLSVQRKVFPSMGMYHIFRVFLNFIATADFANGVAFPSFESEENPDPEVMRSFSNAFPCVFLDPSHRFNLMHRVSQDAMEMLKDDAARCASWLDMGNVEGFTSVFTTKMEATKIFDMVFRIGGLPAETVSRRFSSPWKCNHHWLHAESALLISILRRGLGDRAIAVRLLEETPGSWLVGIILHEDHAFRLVDKGPSPEDTISSEKFVSFWGKKSQIRRFKDGSILHSCTWHRPLHERHLVVEDVVQCIVEEHFFCRMERHGHVSMWASEVDSLLNEISINGQDSTHLFPVVRSAFEGIRSKLQSLQTLPLPLQSVSDISPHLRYSSVTPPMPNLRAGADLSSRGQAGALSSMISNSCVADVIPIVGKFDSSSRWPEDPKAIQRCIQGFLLSMKQELEGDPHNLVCEITEEFLDIRFQGFVFRLFLLVDKQIRLLMQSDPADARRLKTELKERVLLGKMIHALATKYPGYPRAVRIAKRWLHANFLSDVISDDLIEILMGVVFTSPGQSGPFSRIPVGPQSALSRLLFLVHTFPWESAPMIVDFENDLDKVQRAQLQSAFDESSRPVPMRITFPPSVSLPGISLELIPNRQVFAKFVECARQGTTALWRSLVNTLSSTSHRRKKVQSAFFSNLSQFDAVIRLHSGEGRLLKSFKEPAEGMASERLFCGLLPSELLLRELRFRFHDQALFFWDRDVRNTIGILFKPAAMLPHQASAAGGSHFLPLMDPDRRKEASLNLFDFFQNVARLGEGLIRKITFDVNESG